MTTTAQATAVTATARRRRDPASGEWRGPKRPYDIVKEFVIAMVVVGLLVVGLAALFSSPDDRSVTLRAWAAAAPIDFMTTTATELDGSSGSAGYGPPYNSNSTGQQIGPLKLAQFAGVRIPIDSANDFVINPLTALSSADPTVKAALDQWNGASATQQQTWATNYTAAIAKAPNQDPTKVAAGDYGPVPALVAAEYQVALTGALDGALGMGGDFYQTNYTKSLLFIADGGYLATLADNQHLAGDSWGMMNETGSYPGQAWLWLYTFWYQINPFKSSANADALVWGLMMILTLGFILVPFIPVVRSIPRWVPLYRLVWRDYYAKHGGGRH